MNTYDKDTLVKYLRNESDEDFGFEYIHFPAEEHGPDGWIKRLVAINPSVRNTGLYEELLYESRSWRLSKFNSEAEIEWQAEQHSVWDQHQHVFCDSLEDALKLYLS